MRLTLKVLIFFLAILLSVQAARALAVAQPIPSNVTLKRGESLPFRFNIQATISKEDQLCTYSMSGLDPLRVTFENEEVLVEAGKELDVFGTLEVPWNAPLKEYEGKLIVRCRPNIQARGVSLLVDSTRFTFYVKVERLEEAGRLDWKFLLASALVGITIVFLVLFKSKYGLKLRRKKKHRIQKKLKRASRIKKIKARKK